MRSAELAASASAPPTAANWASSQLAEKQVLDDEVPTATEGSDEGGLYEPDEFEHRGRIADHLSPDRRAAFCPPTACREG